ncbi:hypothetical protein [Streptomyces somaliensis]|uniref:Uncharacterized protein n=1 Tax=Streptomyces somaliensis (strain ATCC 33201 / DSM 40738 / JCM 12659 / KCTC 9044 / NCTC 11332 / NRRL B-12077 / IP 733) TaxID=1134445 RepID=A0AA44IF88_STRE0|nr:hypothetical protein [Streptomyces somaliensis]NKY16118.1 hypothetical protein [Streptomyces somaliensis DSM 40738]
MFSRLRTLLPFPARPRGDARAPEGVPRAPRRHNVFEAAAVHVAACAENDEDAMEEAAEWVSPGALSFGVRELACRAVIALARERDEPPEAVARGLLGLPPA